jgi:prepilin-type processing-associated H-X9-DG protein
MNYTVWDSALAKPVKLVDFLRPVELAMLADCINDGFTNGSSLGSVPRVWSDGSIMDYYAPCRAYPDYRSSWGLCSGQRHRVAFSNEYCTEDLTCFPMTNYNPPGLTKLVRYEVDRHNMRANVGFYDGHAKSLTWIDVLTKLGIRPAHERPYLPDGVTPDQLF